MDEQMIETKLNMQTYKDEMKPKSKSLYKHLVQDNLVVQQTLFGWNNQDLLSLQTTIISNKYLSNLQSSIALETL